MSATFLCKTETRAASQKEDEKGSIIRLWITCEPIRLVGGPLTSFTAVSC